MCLMGIGILFPYVSTAQTPVIKGQVVDAKTSEVFSDGKMIGKFNNGSGLNTDALLFGSDPSKICYYNEDGSLSFTDGTKKDMGILFPAVVSEAGKSYITWFRKCKNDIYIGKFEF